MSVTLTGTGGLFTRLGKLAASLNNVNGFRAATAPSPSSAWGASGQTIRTVDYQISDIRDQFLSTNTQLIDGLYAQRDSYRATHSSYTSYLRDLAQAVLIQMVHDDAV